MIKNLLSSTLLASVVILSACSNDDDTPELNNGAVAFLHSVPDVGLIFLDGSERPYGTVGYASVSTPVSLEVGTWDVQPQQYNIDNPNLSRNLLNSPESFSINEDELRLIAITGTFAETKVVSLDLAEDTEADEENDAAIFVNVSHILPGAGDIDVYFLPEGVTSIADTSSGVQKVTVKEMGTSTDLRFNNNKVTMLVTKSGQADEVLFNSGEKTLLDVPAQTIVLGGNPDSSELFTAFYYYLTGTEIWRSNEGQSRVRIFNAIADAPITEATVTVNEEEQDLLNGETLDFEALSDFVIIEAGAYDVSTDVIIESPYLFATSGLYETLVLFGNSGDDAVDALQLSDDQRGVATQSVISITHLAYKSDEEDLATYDVHLVRQEANVNILSRTPEVDDIAFKQTGFIIKTPGTYQLRVIDGSKNVAPMRVLELEGGTNHQLLLIQDGSSTGYQIVDLAEIAAGANEEEAVTQ